MSGIQYENFDFAMRKGVEPRQVWITPDLLTNKAVEWCMLQTQEVGANPLKESKALNRANKKPDTKPGSSRQPLGM